MLNIGILCKIKGIRKYWWFKIFLTFQIFIFCPPCLDIWLALFIPWKHLQTAFCSPELNAVWQWHYRMINQFKIQNLLRCPKLNTALLCTSHTEQLGQKHIIADNCFIPKYWAVRERLFLTAPFTFPSQLLYPYSSISFLFLLLMAKTEDIGE